LSGKDNKSFQWGIDPDNQSVSYDLFNYRSYEWDKWTGSLGSMPLETAMRYVAKEKADEFLILIKSGLTPGMALLTIIER